jgi:HAE1 family hydrophobic/amphiphilic exporter-1
MNSYSYMNGTPSINLSIEKQSTANTVEVSKAIKAEIAALEKEYPDIDFKYLSDNSAIIQISVDSVVDSAVQGALLALLILYVYLRNFRSTIIIGVAIPVSIIFSFVLMYFFKLSLNIVSLGGLTLGIGMLVDNSIVVLENIFRHREDGLSRMEAAYTGVKEVGMAVIASTFTTVAVFLPLIYVEGMVASVFKDMSLTITFSLLASLIVALTVVPMMAAKMLKIKKPDENKKKRIVTRLLDGWGSVLDRIDSVYRKVLNWCIHRKAVTLILMLIIFVVTAYLGVSNGMELMPSVEMGTFAVNASTPQGTSADKNYKIAEEIQSRLHEIAEIKNIYVTITDGAAGARSLMMGGSGGSSVRITADVGSKSERDRSVAQIVDEARQILDGKIAGAELSFSASEMSMSTGSAIAVQISGDDYSILENIATDVMEIVRSVEGTREITSTLEDEQMEAQIYINRNKASLYGLNMQTIAGALANAVTGNIATTYKVNGTEMDVRVVYDPTKVEYMKDIENITIPTQIGGNVTLGDIGTIQIEKAPSTIRREGNKRIVLVQADLFGIDTSTANGILEEKLQGYAIPHGYSYEITGEMEELEESYSSIALAIAAAILLVYMVLAAQFESFLHPFTIMFSIPLSVTGAILSLVIAGKPISMPALIGILMLVGIVVNNAIVLIDYIIQLRAEGLTRTEAILKAGPTRLRPIMMTMLTTVLALVPMSLGMGEGTDMMAPLAITVIGGLLLSTFTTLVIIPVIYDIFDNMKKRKNNEVQPEKPTS